METPCIALLLTGNELMSGDTVDSNSAMIATCLGDHGLEIGEKCTVGDDPTLLQSALARLAQQYPAVIVNGGLGPTRDDLTSEVIATLTDTELTENPEARAHVENWCARRRIAPNPANLKQAFVPAGCQLIHNPLGSALGFAINVKDCLVLTTPGVPSELEAMLPALVTHLEARVGGEARQILRLQTFGIGESSVEERIKKYADRWPNAVTLGFRAGMPQLELKLSVPSAAHLPAQEEALALLEEDFGDHILGKGSTRLAEKLQAVLRNQNKTMTTAESCTGGGIASALTELPGISEIFLEGFVTYSNAAKHADLGVPEQLLETNGAVSSEVVAAMARGAAERAGTDLALSVSGIAGPGGGTEHKPVGLVWFGVYAVHKGEATVHTVSHRFPNADRAQVRTWAVRTGLMLLLQSARDLAKK